MWQVGSDVTSDTEAQRLVSSKGGVSKRSLCVHVCVLNYAGPYRYSANDTSLCLHIQCYVAHMYYHCCTLTIQQMSALLNSSFWSSSIAGAAESCFLAKQLSGKIGHIHGASSHYHYRQVICRTPEAKSKLQRPLIKLIKTQKQTIEH